jgi:hypothetical protein
MRAGKLLAAISVGLMASLGIAASASADTVQVNDPGDSSASTDCTLRFAMDSLASGTPAGGCTITTAGGEDTITFAPSLGATIDLTDGPLIWNGADPLSIAGPGMGSLSISADGPNRVLTVNGATGDLTVSGLTIRDGAPVASSGAVRGGCVLNNDTLTLSGVRVTNCTVSVTGTGDLFADGGGIASSGGSAGLTLTSSLVDHNHGSAATTGAATQAVARGAGIFAQGTGLTIDNSTISANDATGSVTGAGAAFPEGGIEAGAPFTISHSTIAGNSATASTSTGFGIPVGALAVTTSGAVELSTIAGNTAAHTFGGGTDVPSGIYLELANLAVRSSTIALNGPPSGSADGANLTVNGGTATTSNSILADPRGEGENCAVVAGTSGSAGFNDDFSPAGASCFTPPLASDLAVDPLLSSGGLASNGGPTETVALQGTSPVIDAGSNAGDTDLTHDQRGLTRPVDFSGIPNAANGTDIGAFEVQLACAGQATPSTACLGPPSPTPPQPVAPKKKKCKKKKGKKASAAKKKCKKKGKK